jgi:hypothetical protein
MDFGNIIGSFFSDLAANLALAAFGVMMFSTVVCGLIMGLHIGGTKVGEVVRGWFWNIAGCALFTGAATVIIKGIQAKLAVGG